MGRTPLIKFQPFGLHQIKTIRSSNCTWFERFTLSLDAAKRCLNRVQTVPRQRPQCVLTRLTRTSDAVRTHLRHAFGRDILALWSRSRLVGLRLNATSFLEASVCTRGMEAVWTKFCLACRYKNLKHTLGRENIKGSSRKHDGNSNDNARKERSDWLKEEK